MNQESNTQNQIKQPPKLPNPLAFPRAAFHPGETTNSNWSFHNRSEDGMQLRDYFAIRVLAARITFEKKESGVTWLEYITHESELAYEVADKLLEARIK